MNYNDRSSTIELEDGRPDLVKRSISKSRADNEIPAQENGFGDELSTEQIFASKQVPGWREQITFRGLFVSLIVSILLSVIVMKLSLTTGVIPSLNVSAGLLGFFFVKSWVKLLERSGLLKTPFTRQENTVIQTCVVASTGISFSGGFGSYLLAMSSRIYGEVGTTPGNNPSDTKDPQLGWIMGFLFVVSFLGLFAVVALRKIMIIDYKLTYPSGTATAVLINGFHTPQGSIVARKQVAYLGKYFVFSFLFGFFQWFYTGGDNCGFANFPTLGMKARDNKFYFDFSMTYIGAGMICPHLVNISLVVGAIASYGIMWPLIKNRKGDWYDSGLKPNSMSGLQGYKVFISIALILGDGLYNFAKITYITLSTIYRETKKKNRAVTDLNEQHPDEIPYDEQRRNEFFLKDNIPLWMAVCGYVVLAAISIGVIPHMFPAVKWYYVLMAYIVAPVLGFCNAYGCGLTDWSLSTSYGKLALFIFGAWAGKDHGGVMAALSTCGVMMSIVATASDLTQDFKTGYLTLSSPRAMFLAQVIGTAMGCIIAPSIFILFNKAFDLGNQQGEYPSPNALVFRNMAILAVEGFSALPKHCLTLCYGFFAFAIVVNLIRDKVPKRISQRIPIPMAMAIPFFLGGYFTIDMFVGTIIVFIWQRRNRTSADLYVPAVASGLLCGDGIWSLPSSILALAKVKAPICMKFLPRSVNVKVDGYLGYN